MRSSRLHRLFGLAALAFLFSFTAKADNFYGDTVIDFDALGGTSYDLYFFASTVAGGSDTGYAYAGFGSAFYASSVCNEGEAGAGMYIYGVTKVNGQWTASEVILAEEKSDASGYNYTYYYNVPVPSSATAYGHAECDDHEQGVSGTIDIY